MEQLHCIQTHPGVTMLPLETVLYIPTIQEIGIMLLEQMHFFPIRMESTMLQWEVAHSILTQQETAT